MAQHDSPCPLAIEINTKIGHIEEDMETIKKTLFGNGNRSEGLTYIVQDLRNGKRDWLHFWTMVIGIISILIAIWAAG